MPRKWLKKVMSPRNMAIQCCSNKFSRELTMGIPLLQESSCMDKGAYLVGDNEVTFKY
jgi:hypothetical protein